MISSSIEGVCGYIFNDFLTNHTINDLNENENNENNEILIENIQFQANNSAIITCISQENFLKYNLNDNLILNILNKQINIKIKYIINHKNMIIEFNNINDINYLLKNQQKLYENKQNSLIFIKKVSKIS